MIGTAGASLGRWARKIDANDTDPSLTVDQRGTGNIVEFQDGGTAVFTIADGGAITITGTVTHSADVILQDDVDLALGTGSDGLLRLSSANAHASSSNEILCLRCPIIISPSTLLMRRRLPRIGTLRMLHTQRSISIAT